MSDRSRFNALLEHIEALPLADQTALIEILQHRVQEKRRTELAAHIAEAQREYQQGKVLRGTFQAIMAELNP